MKNTFKESAVSAEETGKMIRVGVIGLGARVTHVLSTLCTLDSGVRLAGVADPAIDLARNKIATRKFPGGETARVVSDAEELLQNADDLDAVLIGTRCNLHTPLAIQVAKTGLPLFLEKPVATNWTQLRDLAAAFEGHDQQVVISFPLRCTSHVQKAGNIIRSGRLGTINQLQALNYVPYGGVYFGQWYRDSSITGGLWLAKTTHDFDYMNCLLGATPIAVTAMHGRVAYGGEMPADLTCLKCDRYSTCPESPRQLTARGDDGGTLMGLPLAEDSDHLCNFSRGILNQDAGAALIMYDSGVHGSYTQNFISRQSAGFRGATVTGYNATLTLDFRGAKIRVIEHHRPLIEEIPVRTTANHFGGDEVLIQNFLDVIRQRQPSIAPLRSGLISAAMCLAARDAASNGMTQKLPALPGLEAPSVQLPIVEPST